MSLPPHGLFETLGWANGGVPRLRKKRIERETQVYLGYLVFRNTTSLADPQLPVRSVRDPGRRFR